MKKVDILDYFFEGEAHRLGISVEFLDIICEKATDEELDQLLGDNFQPIINKYKL